MEPSITYLHLRNNIAQLPVKERHELLMQLIENGIDLTREEEEYLSRHDMKYYVGKLFQRMSHPTAYELNFADDTEKDIYVMNPKRLEILIPIMKDLDDSWRKTILTMAVFSNKGLEDSVFKTLPDKDKRFYANLCIVNSDYSSAEVVKYMSPKNQRLVIKQILERGEAFSNDHFKSLTKENQRLYRKLDRKRKNIQESVRNFIRKIINETVEK